MCHQHGKKKNTKQKERGRKWSKNDPHIYQKLFKVLNVSTFIMRFCTCTVIISSTTSVNCSAKTSAYAKRNKTTTSVCLIHIIVNDFSDIQLLYKGKSFLFLLFLNLKTLQGHGCEHIVQWSKAVWAANENQNPFSWLNY